MSRSEVKLRFILASATLSSAQLMDAAGIKPSRTWERGDRVHPKATNRHRESGVEVEVIGRSLSDVSNQLMDQLRPHVDTLKKIEGTEREISCIVYIRDGAPELHLDRSFVKFAADLVADVDFDVYVMEN